MAEGDKSLSGAAEHLGIRRETLRAYINDLNIKPHLIGGTKVISAEKIGMIEAAVREHANRLTLCVTAKRLRMSPNTLASRMKLLGITPQKIGRAKLITKEQFAEIKADDRPKHRAAYRKGAKPTDQQRPQGVSK